MTRDEHLQTIAIEECAEVAQRFTKALRFGMSEVQPGQFANNAERIQQEFNELVAVMDMLGFRVYAKVDYEARRAKRLKVEQYLVYSVECGTLDKS